MATFNASIIASGDDGTWVPSIGAFDGGSGEVAAGKPASVGGVATHLFLRVTNVTIEQGDTIDSAVGTLIATLTQSSATVNLTIFCVAADNAAAPTTVAGAEALALTSASVAWNAIAGQSSGVAQQTPNAAGPMQEVIDRPGWQSGNAIVFVIRDNGSTANAYRGWASFDHTTFAAPALAIDYTASTIALSGTAAGAATTSGALTATVALAGTAAGQASTSGDLVTSVALAGTAAGAGLASAALTVGVAPVELAGTLAAAASVTGALAARAALVGSAAGAASSTGALTVLVFAVPYFPLGGILSRNTRYVIRWKD